MHPWDRVMLGFACLVLGFITTIGYMLVPYPARTPRK